ncbi:MAG: Nif3-like dinuclear metal center hexameric protein [Clostridia bacterium]|nr:Nif3-like dinuclear metal center hexameric protein [Clostridia bacterium]
MELKVISDFFDRIAPQSRSSEWDNDGTMLLGCNKDIKKVLITLDVNSEAIENAINNNVNLIISHHPFIFRPIKRISDDLLSDNIRKLIKNDISVLSYHTRMDASDVGINQYILQKLGLDDIKPFGEEPESFIGRIGTYNSPVDSSKFYNLIKKVFNCSHFTVTAPLSEVKSVAVVSGGGNEFADTARSLGADVFISGEFRHHQYIHHTETGFPVISIDHYHCENVFVDLVYQLLTNEFTDIELIKNYGNAPFSDITI